MKPSNIGNSRGRGAKRRGVKDGGGGESEKENENEGFREKINISKRILP